jgi:phage tail sheath gpL-like
MKRIIRFTALSVVLLMLTVSVSNAQGKLGVVGKLFSKSEAKTLFGKVVGSITIDKKELQQAISKAGDYVLLAIKNNRLIVCNEKRVSFTSTADVLSKEQPMYIFSTSVLQKFLQSKTSTTTLSKGTTVETTAAATTSAITVEVRAEVLTLSNDTETLEMSMICPPVCFD